MKSFIIVVVGFLSALSAGVSVAQNGHMMDGGVWMGGYRGVWGPIVLVLIIGLVVWVVLQRRK
ncbi:MAG: hypothetical protein Q8L60_07465 [Gammaproteobacteria bacterium]|nr:hypothetical protein [Gammaproteobacteria bacterium]MDP2348190.1 hypothetical protein [Gammaproteobacteria bacterium]